LVAVMLVLGTMEETAVDFSVETVVETAVETVVGIS